MQKMYITVQDFKMYITVQDFKMSMSSIKTLVTYYIVLRFES
jgi:hypothetical protein